MVSSSAGGSRTFGHISIAGPRVGGRADAPRASAPGARPPARYASTLHRPTRSLIAAVPASAAVSLLALGCAGSPSRPSTENATARPPVSAGGVPVAFAAADGRRLSGRDYGTGDDWAVLVRGDERDARTWSGLVAELTSHGFRVLTFDRDRSSAKAGRSHAKRLGDVRAALAYARSRGAARLFVVGAGTGATAALNVATRFPIRALVALSPRVGRNARKKPPPVETRAPKLIIVGWLDSRAAEDAETVFHRSIGWTVLNSAPVAAQGTALLASSWGGNVREQITAFLLDYLSL